LSSEYILYRPNILGLWRTLPRTM